MLLLRVLRLAANELPTSIVAFSFCEIFESSVCTPMDFLERRVAGMVASPDADMMLVEADPVTTAQGQELQL